MSAPPVFLYEKSLIDSGEEEAAQEAGFLLARGVLGVPENSLVVARHYAWPWPDRLDRDLAARNSRALNNRHAYWWFDRPQDWAPVLEGITPRTWTDLAQLPPTGAFILKAAHADKAHWSRMYAPNREKARELYCEMQRDTGFRTQEVVIREYVPLRRLGPGIGGCPPSEEYRVFMFEETLLSCGFYWNRDDCTEASPHGPDEDFYALVREAARRVTEAGRTPYYTLDIARTEAGDWTVIEISDGQRAGLSENEPGTLYRALYDALKGRL